MRRLLHGEVGSGKTAVCTAAAQLMAETGGITLWLVPTTTLVRQHGRSVGTWWPRHLAPWGHVTGSSSSGERKRIAEELRDGRLSGCIGTQALFDDMFKSLPIGLVMVDEEQRFGVAQRQQLLQPHAGIEPHYLGCSATPIPRSLALVSHGGTELSRLDERPPGRQAVTTAIQGWRMGSVESAIAKCLEHQGAVFVIVPRKQAGLKRSAVELGKHLAQRFGSERVQSCTGDDPEAVQHERIEALQAGSIDVLVATTVIEVGIDVPRAELMIVCDAEFFGLAQLHQLRGRLGRGHRPGHCLLLSASTTGRARIQALADLDNGFAVAAEDLRQRGSGSLDGEAQHGHGALFCLDPVQDEDLLEAAPAAADTAYPDAESWFSSVNPTDDPGDGSG
jgi:ATP-dependent DNA helicase RecG